MPYFPCSRTQSVHRCSRSARPNRTLLAAPRPSERVSFTLLCVPLVKTAFTVLPASHAKNARIVFATAADCAVARAGGAARGFDSRPHVPSKRAVALQVLPFFKVQMPFSFAVLRSEVTLYVP